jgi:hypothetical protein
MIIIAVEDDPRMQFTIDVDASKPPQIIEIKGGQKLILVGKYASPGDKFSYRHISRVYNHCGEIKEWPKYSELTG